MAETEPRYLITDSTTCQAVLAEAVAELRAGGSTRVDLEDHDFAVFRFGSYYAIVLVEQPKAVPGEVVTGWSPLMIFEVAGLAYVFTIMT